MKIDIKITRDSNGNISKHDIDIIMKKIDNIYIDWNNASDAHIKVTKGSILHSGKYEELTDKRCMLIGWIFRTYSPLVNVGTVGFLQFDSYQSYVTIRKIPYPREDRYLLIK